PLGLCAGFAFLFRADLGVGCLAAGLAGSFFLRWRRAPLSRVLHDFLPIISGFALPVAMWGLVLCGYGGPRAVVDYLDSYMSGATGLAKHVGLPIPHVTLRTFTDPFSFEAGADLLFCLPPALAALGLGWSLIDLVRSRATLQSRLCGTACFAA